MKNRFIYSILLVSVMSQMSFAQELSQTQDSTGPQPYEVLPAMVVSDEVTVPAVPEVPVLPEPPQAFEPEEESLLMESEAAPMMEFSAQEEVKDEASPQKSKQIDKAELNIGLDENKRKEVVSALKVLLSDEYLLYTKTFKYHWNVQGKHFGALHEFFQKQYEALQGFSDGVAERIRMLGFMPPATFAEFTQFATLREQPGHNPEDLGMIADLLKDHEQIIRNMRGYIDLTAKVNDMGTNNFLADLIEKHEKMAWMLRAHLEQ